MQQNEQEYEYGEIDRRKVALAVLALFVVAASIIIAIYLFTDQTKASTGTGTAVISPERIKQISDEVSDDVLDTIRTEILTEMVGQSVEEELTAEKIYDTITESGSDVKKLVQKDIRTVVKELLSKQKTGKADADRGAFTEKQEAMLRRMIDEALTGVLSSVDVNHTLTEEEKRGLEEELRQRLSVSVQPRLPERTGKLTKQELADIRKSVLESIQGSIQDSAQIEKQVKKDVKSEMQQQAKKLTADIMARVKKSMNTSSKNYLTKDQAEKLQEKVLEKAGKAAAEKAEKLAEEVKLVKTSVSELTTRIQELKTLNEQKTADLSTMQASIQEINRLMNEIDTVTKELTKSVSIVDKDLIKVTGEGSKVKSEPVSAANMTVAEFVDVLAGNDKAYTGAIQELDKLVEQLKEENKNQDTAFEKSVKELEQSLDKNGEELEQFKARQDKQDENLEQFKTRQDEKDEEWNRQMQQQTKEQGSQLKEQAARQEELLKKEQEERKEADSRLQSQVDDTGRLIGDKDSGGKIEGDTVFEKIGSIVKILSADGLGGLVHALNNIGGAKTIEEGVTNIHSGLTDAAARVGELEKEKWYSDITLLADGDMEKPNAYVCQESGSAYVYQIPLVADTDNFSLEDPDAAIVIDFKKPDKLPSNAAFSTNGNCLLITFTNKPTRDIEIVSIHVYMQK